MKAVFGFIMRALGDLIKGHRSQKKKTGSKGSRLRRIYEWTRGFRLISFLLALAIWDNWLFGLILTVLVVFGLGLIFFKAYWLAERGILFTLPKEGTVQTIMAGKSGKRQIMAYRGSHQNIPRKPWYRDTDKDGNKIPAWEVLLNDPSDFPGFAGDDQQLAELYDDRPPILKELGLHWVGIWPFRRIRWYKFEWNELRQDEKGVEKIWPRAEPTNYIAVNDRTYISTVPELKTNDLLEVTSVDARTFRINNPWKATFRAPSWLQRVGTAIDREVKNHIGFYTYAAHQAEALKQQEHATKTLAQTAADGVSGADHRDPHPSFSTPILSLNECLRDEPAAGSPYERGLRGRYGVTLIADDLRKVQLSGKGEEENSKATTAVYVATQTAAATMKEKDAEAYGIEKVGDAEAKSLAARLKVIEGAGQIGLAIARYDMLAEASKNPNALLLDVDNRLGAADAVKTKAAMSLATGSRQPQQPVQAQPGQGGAS